MQAGLTPLTFTVGPRPPPGLLALRRHQVTDPEPGAEDHHCGWARAPHAERAAPNASATGTRRQARRYGGKLLQDAGERSKPGVARTNDATHSTHSSHWLAPKGPRTGRSTGALSFFFFFFCLTGACALQHTRCRFSGAGKTHSSYSSSACARGGTFTLIGDSAGGRGVWTGRNGRAGT